MTEHAYTTGYSMRVLAGAQLLDAERPGWERDVDLASLDQEDTCACVLGQLHGGREDGYTRGLLSLGIRGGGARFGFSTWGRETWQALTAEWRELITERRAAER